MGFFDKIFSGLTKTRTNMAELEELFQGYQPDSEEFYDDLEDLLVMSDVGAVTAEKIVQALKKMTWERRFRKGYEAREGLVELLSNMLTVNDASLKLDTTPSVILMVGVNGVGKTTTIGKLAHQFIEQGKKVLLGAADTFRAAAGEQLGVWADRVGCQMIKHAEGADPAAVVYDSITAAKARNVDVLICDTAGRLHTKKNLMEELRKISRVITREYEEAEVRTLLVIDATTGQNGLQQAREFSEVADVSGIVLTKLDGTAKGGIAVAIMDELKLPVLYIGVGEGIEDLQAFDANAFVDAIF